MAVDCSPASLAVQGTKRGQRQNVATVQAQLANLTKKYKNTKDKLQSTGYGRGGDVPSDNESEESEDIIPKHPHVPIASHRKCGNMISLRKMP